MRLLKTPEVQFFALFTIPFVGFFLLNYLYLPAQHKMLALILFFATLLIVFFQTTYSIVAHARLKREERELLAATAHHVGAPLTAVKWTLEELAKKEVREAERLELSAMAAVALQKLTNMIASLVHMSQADDEGAPQEIRDVNLNELAQEVVTENALLGKQRGVAFFAEPAPVPLHVRVDPRRLAIALGAFVANGSLYNHTGGMVTVRLRALTTDNLAEVVIEDTGIGITITEQQQLFSRYYRTEGAQKLNAQGSGLGLFLAKKIIEGYGGRIWVESVPGKGSAFHFTLPLVAQA
jgi:signal transduction histidine kinase